MDEKELLEKIQREVKSTVEDGLKNAISKTEMDKGLEALNDKISKLSDESILKIKEQLSDLAAKYGEVLDASKQAELAAKNVQTVANSKPKSFEQNLEDAFMAQKGMLTEKNDDNGKRYSLKEYFSKMGNPYSPSIVVKDAVEMLGANIIGANVSTIMLTQTVGTVQVPLSIYPNVFSYIPTISLSKPTMSYTIFYEFVSGTATKPEGTASAKSSLKVKTVEIKSFNIASHVVMSEETLDDLPSVIAELRRILPVDIKEKIQAKIFSAAGDDSSDIAGMLTSTKHTDFVATNYENTVTGANVVDVFQDMKLAAEAEGFEPNMVILDPKEIAKLASLKDALDNSVKDNRVIFGAFGVPTYICGLAIVAYKDLGVNKAIVLDINNTQIGIRKDMNIEIGRNGTDLTEGQYTAVASMRVAFGVAAAKSVIYCADIAGAISTIEAGA